MLKPTRRTLLAGLALLGCALPTYAQSAQSLSVASWNLEWLTSQPNHSVKESQRSKGDLHQLQRHFNVLQPSLLAFQEVNDVAVLRQVVGQSYDILLSDRAKPSHHAQQFNDINQYTGLAIRHGIPYHDAPDLRLDNRQGSKLRFATYAILYPKTKQPIHVLSVHLKAGCSSAYHNTRECQTLKAQGKKLNQWLQQREQAKEAYLILGDFNHNLAYRGDWLWSTLHQGLQQAPTLTTQHTAATCHIRSSQGSTQTFRFRSLIDHIIASPALNAHTAQQADYDHDSVLHYQLSDHCPLSSQIEPKR